MVKKQLYTLLSRTTNLEYIHLSNELLNKRYIPRIYVGSTCQELQDRLHEHVTDKKGAVYKYRNDKLKIELLVYAPRKDKKSLIKE